MPLLFNSNNRYTRNDLPIYVFGCKELTGKSYIYVDLIKKKSNNHCWGPFQNIHPAEQLSAEQFSFFRINITGAIVVFFRMHVGRAIVGEAIVVFLRIDITGAIVVFSECISAEQMSAKQLLDQIPIHSNYLATNHLIVTCVVSVYRRKNKQNLYLKKIGFF